ncbi:hypothetical protein [Olsenella intestinalis]|uniref:hypothetical protein n=1 Tax=Olsenella intestinalis TaxID=2930083 RepID=UPI00200D65CE|nr:hypothetical protein [Olsenella intestinalis]
MTDNDIKPTADDTSGPVPAEAVEPKAGAKHTAEAVSQVRHASRHLRDDSAEAQPAEKSRSVLGDRLAAEGMVPVLVCLLAAVLIAGLVCVLHVPKYAADIDDYAQALYARGALFDTTSYLMPYSMVIYSAPVAFLYGLLPSVPWYPLSLLAIQAVSFAALFNLGRKIKASVALRVFVLAALALCEFAVCDYLTFSATAVVAFAAGMSLVLARGCFSRPRSLGAGAALGYVLVLVGVAVRYDVCLAATLVFVPFLVWAVIHNRNLRTMLMALGVVACIAVSYVSGQVAWRTCPGWEDYVPNQEAASSIADYPRVSYEDVSRVAPHLSKNDVDMLYDFMFVDSDPYSLETFQAIDGAVQTFSTRTLMDAVRSRVSYTMVVFGLQALAFATAVVIATGRGRAMRSRWLPFAVCGVTLVVTFLLFLRARPRVHVVLPLFVATIFALVVAALNDREADAQGEQPSAPRLAKWLGVAAPVMGIVCFALLAALVEVKYARPLQRSLSAELTAKAQSYVDAHPDQTVLFLRSQGVIENHDAFAFDRWDVPDNVVMIGGGYEYYTTPWKNYLSRAGLDRTHYLSYLVEDKGMVSVSSERIAHMVETYLAEHTGKAVHAEKVQSIGRGTQSPEEYFVWRYVADASSAPAAGAPAAGTPAAGAPDGAAPAVGAPSVGAAGAPTAEGESAAA